MRGGKMNAASNKLQVTLSNGKAIWIQVMHLANPVGSKENLNDLAEDYCVISEDGGTKPFLFRVVAHRPLAIEQMYAANPEGQSHWRRVEVFFGRARVVTAHADHASPRLVSLSISVIVRITRPFANPPTKETGCEGAAAAD